MNGHQKRSSKFPYPVIEIDVGRPEGEKDFMLNTYRSFVQVALNNVNDPEYVKKILSQLLNMHI